MNTDKITSALWVPSFAKVESYDFDAATDESMVIYEELSQISEEIEKCRSRNC